MVISITLKSVSHSTKTHLKVIPPLMQFNISFSSCQIYHPAPLESLRKTHLLLLVTGRRPDTAFTSKLLSYYCRFGRITDAQKLFGEMPDKNVVSWSTMIYGYARNGFYLEPLKLFSQMQVSGVVPNSFTLVAILVCSAGLENLNLGSAVHGRVVKTGLEYNSFVGTAMLDTYAKCGNIADSYKLFKQMDELSLISCNALISGYVRNELFEEALLLFNKIRVFGLVPNFVTMLSVIQGCIAIVSVSLCKSVHAYIVKIGLDLNVYILNSVLDMYLSLGNLDVAAEFFQNMVFKDVISWTTMMASFVRCGRASDCLKLFSQMRDYGIHPDTVAAVNIIAACGLLGDLMRGRLIHSWIMVVGFFLELSVSNSLIVMYSKCGDLDSARTVFNCMVEKSLVSWTAMISGYVQNGQPRGALRLLLTMRIKENFDLDSITLVGALTACGELAGLGLCKQLHAYVFAAGFLQYNSIQNSLLMTYARCGDVEIAHNVFREIACPDIVSWNAMISGYGINGNGVAAVSLFHEMVKSSEEPDNVTYLSVLNACSHSGLVDEGLMTFSQMVNEKRIRPREEHFGCVVDMLVRAGRFEDVNEFVNNVSGEVDLNVWRALLGGCRIHNNVTLAELAANKVFQLDPEDSGQVVLLSNLYASLGRFEEAEALRLSMRLKGLTKNPGLSMLDVVPHDFG
ncbi:pentatricopeptide repeat-containing protein At1g11290, chloroplastic-like [Magnolia sinica]|uniref:pentatricopeptide repeat-containing protein At1g11290, chloroplastic-like n=1 Tax=Magnolia sinica TaxID=86752 RepID=UPI0026582331|nr:pentatricopeptide repeat-containing protein At1g11290, chloroplastic-like [Magnolia sinica]